MNTTTTLNGHIFKLGEAISFLTVNYYELTATPTSTYTIHEVLPFYLRNTL